MDWTRRALPWLAALSLLYCGCPTADDDDDTADDDAGDDDGADDDGGDDDTDNQPPEITSSPVTEFVLSAEFDSDFAPNQLFVSSSRTDEVRVYDAGTLAFVQAFTHPLFSDPVGDSFMYGPNGLAFNQRGNLVVAAHSAFVEFSDYGVEYAVYPKVDPEPTENVLLDRLGNLYTTTSTGGTDKLNQYRALDYAFEQTIEVPPGAGQLTGITIDGRDRLYLASQTDATIHMAEADSTFTTFTWSFSYDASGAPGSLEGIQFNRNGELVAAAGDMLLYEAQSGAFIGSFDAPDDAFPVPVRVDNSGSIFTADYENGSGTLPADIYKFSPDGSSFITVNDPDLWGPFGGAVSGTVLSGDPPLLYLYPVVAVDPDGDTLTYTLTEGPVSMSLDEDTGELTWPVTSLHVGTTSVSIHVSDGNGGSDSQDFELEIAAG